MYKIHYLDTKKGLKDFEIVPFDCETPDIPRNIYICQETKSQKAIREMFWAVNTAPYNAAIWDAGHNGLGRSLKESFLNAKDPAKLHPFAQDPYMLINPGFMHSSLSDNNIAEILTLYEDMSLIFKADHAKNPAVQNYFKFLDRIISEYFHAFDCHSHSEITLASTKARLSEVRLENDTHLDTRHMFTKDLKIGKHVFVNALRSVWSQRARGTVLADNDDIIFQKQNDIWDYTFKNPVIKLWEPPLWSLVMLTDEKWTHKPIVHASPSRQVEEIEDRRIFWDFHYSADKASLEKHYKDYKKFLAKNSVPRTAPQSPGL